jgi:hypothetical protein
MSRQVKQVFMHGFPFLPFPIIFLLTSTGQTGKPISMDEGSNDVFTPKEVPFWVSLKKFQFTGPITPKNRKEWAWSTFS